MKFSIQVLDDQGNVVKVVHASANQSDIDYYSDRSNKLTSLADIALYNAAPEFCPFDCDRCHD